MNNSSKMEVSMDCEETAEVDQSSEQSKICESQVSVELKQNINFHLKENNCDSLTSEPTINYQNEPANDSETLCMVSELCKTTKLLSEDTTETKSQLNVTPDVNVNLHSINEIKISSEFSPDFENISITQIEEVNIPALYIKDEVLYEVTKNECLKRKNYDESENLNNKRLKPSNVTKNYAPSQKSNYHCTHCPRFFRSSRMLDVHLKFEHCDVIETDNVRKNVTLHYCPVCNICYGKKIITVNHIVQSHPAESSWAIDNISTMSHKITDVTSSKPAEENSHSNKNMPSLRVSITDINLKTSVQNNTNKSPPSVPNKISKIKPITPKHNKKSKCKSKLKINTKSNSSNKSIEIAVPKIQKTLLKNSVQNSPKPQTVPPLKIKLSSIIDSKKRKANVTKSPKKCKSTIKMCVENVIECTSLDKQLENYKCSYCKDVFESSNLMSYHKVKEHSELYKINVKAEIASKVTKSRFFCTECDSHFPCVNDCAFHVKKIHTNIDDITSKIELKNTTFWLCTTCHRSRSFKYFTTELELLQHVIDHHDIDVNPCVSEITKNNKTTVNAYICAKCSLPFKLLHVYRNHFHRKHHEFKFSATKILQRKMCIKKCQYNGCKKQFFHKSKLAEHEKVCSYNQKSLFLKRIDSKKLGNDTIKDNVSTKDIKIDTKYYCKKYFKRQRCPKCSRGFVSKSHCRKHLVSYHAVTDLTDIDIKLENMLQWSCKVCNTGSQVNNCYSNHDMEIHLFASHNIIGTIDEQGNFHEKDSLHDTQLIDHSILKQAILSAGIDIVENSQDLNPDTLELQDIDASNSEIQTPVIHFDNSLTVKSISDNITETIEESNCTETDIQSTLEICETSTKLDVNKPVKQNIRIPKRKNTSINLTVNDAIFTKFHQNIYYCGLCSDSYTTPQNLDKHTSKKHGTYKQQNVATEKVIAWKCNICKGTGKVTPGLLIRSVTNEKEMELHFEIRHNLVGNIMKNGDFVQNGVKILLSNISEDHYDVQKVNLKNERVITTCKVFNTEKQKRYHCPHCNENYTSSQNVQKHALKKHRMYKCNFNSLKISFSKVWRCKVCNPSKVLHNVHSNDGMLQHLKCEHLINGKIDELGKFIQESASTYSDNVINLGKNVCGKETFRRYVCTVCSKHFEQKTNCVSHMERIHSQNNVITKHMLLWICFLCKNNKPVQNCNNNLDMEYHVKNIHELTGYIDDDDNFIQTNIETTETVVKNIEIDELQVVEKEFEIEAANLLNEFQNSSIVVVPANNDIIDELETNIDPSQDIPEIVVDFSKIPIKARTRFYCPECNLDFGTIEIAETHIKCDHIVLNYVNTCKNIIERTSDFYICEICTYYSPLKYLPDQLSYKQHIQKYHLVKLKNKEIDNNALSYNETLSAIHSIELENNIVNNEITYYDTSNLLELLPEYSNTIELIETEVIQDENIVDMEHSNFLETTHVNNNSNVMIAVDTNEVYSSEMFVNCDEVINTYINEINASESISVESNNKCNEICESEIHKCYSVVQINDIDIVNKTTDQNSVVSNDVVAMNVINEDVLLQEMMMSSFICPLCPNMNYRNLKDIQNHITKKHSNTRPPVSFETKQVPFWICNLCKENEKPYRNIYKKSVFPNHLKIYHNIYIDDGRGNSEISTPVTPSKSCEGVHKMPKENYTNKSSAVRKVPETVKNIAELQLDSSSRRRTSKWTCNICNKNFKDKYSLLDHKDMVHYNTELNTNKKKIECKESISSKPKTSDKKILLKLTIPKVVGKIAKNPTNEKIVQCTKCEKAYKNINLLKIHYIDIHISGNIFSKQRSKTSGGKKCKLCPANVVKTFKDKKLFYAHISEIHDDILNQDFEVIKNTLKIVECIQLNENNILKYVNAFKCHCNALFLQQKALLKHFELKHNNVENKFTEKASSMGKCRFCDKYFFYKSNLKEHERTHLSGNVMCLICDVTIEGSVMLDFHKFWLHDVS